MRKLWTALAVLSLAACGGTMQDDGSVDTTTGALTAPGNTPDVKPTGRGGGLANKPSSGARRTSSNGINYHGGPVMTSAQDVYFIWYGNWSGNSATNILQNFATNLSSGTDTTGKNYFKINTTYYNGSNVYVSNAVSYKGSTTDNYSQGTALSDAQVQQVVSDAITSGRLPKDTNGVYFVLTSSDVNETSGFCTQYCGWHTHGTISGSDIKYSFIGNPDRCPSACEGQSTGPNGNAGADGMASILAHELEEATTDPDANAWYDVQGNENGDKCAWKFGTTATASNGSQYNLTVGGSQYYIQMNWVNASGGYCANGI